MCSYNPSTMIAKHSTKGQHIIQHINKATDTGSGTLHKETEYTHYETDTHERSTETMGYIWSAAKRIKLAYACDSPRTLREAKETLEEQQEHISTYSSIPEPDGR